MEVFVVNPEFVRKIKNTMFEIETVNYFVKKKECIFAQGLGNVWTFKGKRFVRRIYKRNTMVKIIKSAKSTILKKDIESN